MKKNLLLILSFLLYVNANAQLEFIEHKVADNRYTVVYPESVFSIDLDNDGDLDALSASIDKVAWYENLDGLGNFGFQQIIQGGDIFATSVYSVDIDNDGDNDVIATLRIIDEVVWYENTDGKGTFSDKKVITNNANWAMSVYAADIDNDGDFDVISASEDDNKIAWYENLDGRGGFGSQKIISSSARGAQFVYASDLDGDGDMDVISASEDDDKIAWYENIDGSGTFTEHVISLSYFGVQSLHTNDLDGDGDIDIVCAAWPDSNRIGWFENTDGLGNFVFHQIFHNTSSSRHASVYSGDIDNDGDIDVIASTNLDLIWFENEDGLGSFGTGQIAWEAFGASDVQLSDLDNDGDLDIFSSKEGTPYGKISWNENIDGLGNFGPFQSITTDNLIATATYSVDLDGDGDNDILASYSTDGKLVWYENMDGQGNFGDEIVISRSAQNASSIVSADIDGDGDMDVLADSSEGTAWYKNTDGLGNFVLQQPIIGSGGPAHAVDIDNDGDIDVISQGTGNIGLYENLDGLGNFSDRNTIYVGSILSIYLDDLDLDNDVDIVIGSYFNNYISWIENTNGQGAFGSEQLISIDAPAVRSVYTEDIDGDGDNDVLVGTTSFNTNTNLKVAWYENLDGQGNFSTEKILSTDIRAGLVYATDLDNDNDIDVISINDRNRQIYWYENMDGLGNFSAEQIIFDDSISEEITSVYIEDIDGDNAKDIIYSVREGRVQLVWLENSLSAFNAIKGKILIDVNSDGCDVSDLPVHNLMISTTDGTNEFATFTQNNGDYILFTDEGSFTTTISSSIPTYLGGTPNSQTSNFNEFGNEDNDNDFCLEIIQSINDLNIAIYPRLEARPGFDTTYRLVYNNNGTTVQNGNILFEFDDSKLNFLSASTAPTSQTTNSLTFNFSNLNPFETRVIDINLNVYAPPTTNIDDILTFRASINPITGDNTEVNNVFEFNETVIGSFDPNDILVLEGEQILLEDADNYLHYIIRFQNTGTASAINVRVENILDMRLDWDTMLLESSSHANRVEIKNGKNVSFIFDGINLPDSTTDEPSSHGFIAYKIKPRTDVVIGDIIMAQADIYFDFNTAITTNTVSTEIVTTLGMEKSALIHFEIFPNPSNGVLNIRSKTQIAKLEIYNNLGQIVLSEQKTNSIDISTFNTGLYFMVLEDINGNKVIKKLIKK